MTIYKYILKEIKMYESSKGGKTRNACKTEKVYKLLQAFFSLGVWIIRGKKTNKQKKTPNK